MLVRLTNVILEYLGSLSSLVVVVAKNGPNLAKTWPLYGLKTEFYKGTLPSHMFLRPSKGSLENLRTETSLKIRIAQNWPVYVQNMALEWSKT